MFHSHIFNKSQIVDCACRLCLRLRLTRVESENQPFALAICRGHGLRRHTCKNRADRVWSGGAREHYVIDISDRKLLSESFRDVPSQN